MCTDERLYSRMCIGQINPIIQKPSVQSERGLTYASALEQLIGNEKLVLIITQKLLFVEKIVPPLKSA